MDYSNELAARQLQKLKIRKISVGIAYVLVGVFTASLGGAVCAVIGGVLTLAGVGTFIQVYKNHI